MNPNEKIKGFTVKRVRPVAELDGELIELTHDKTGLEALWLKRDEENKTFGIAFETLPWNDTGVFHILEHSVLCGSDKYQVKEPFVELMKNSMNTFLNAMTYPDKTVYPVCSRNNKDFINLMRVYLDAVFHPLIYSKPEIFGQEGWHYEFDENGKPSYKGVVFNEMKGAMADADKLMMCAINKALFPDSPYKYVSGGDPAKIPDLSYEEFISSHRKFYSPSNAYLFLDGDMNIEEILGIIDGDYLKDFDKTERIAPPALQAPVKPDEITVEFELGEGEDGSKKTKFGWAGVIGRYDDKEKLAAIRVLAKVLSGSNQAPLNKAILSQGLAEEVSIYLYDGVMQPWVGIQVKNLEAANLAKVEEVIFSELKRLSEEGLDHEQLEAVMANSEFKLRERDYGYAPRGLIFGLGTLDTWLYGGDPIDNLEVGDLFVNMKKKMDEGMFEAIIKEVFLNNDHSCKVVLIPSTTAGEERRELEAKRLADESASWSDSDVAALKEKQRILDEWQHSEDSPEALKTLPSLELSDISKEPDVIPTAEEEIAGIKVLRHDINTSGIVYYNLYFAANGLGETDISTLAFLCELLGEMETSEHSEEEIINLKRLICGNVNFSVETFVKSSNASDFSTKLVVSFSALNANADKAVKLIVELLTKTLFEKESVALDLLRQVKMRYFQQLVMAGSAYAMSRICAQHSAASVIDECAGGYSYYKWLKDTESSWNWAELKESLRSVKDRIVTKNGLVVGATGDSDVIGSTIGILAAELSDTAPSDGNQIVKAWGTRREGIVIPADICFASVGGDIIANNGSYSGRELLAGRVISLAYLWNAIRVQGGAYGTGFTVRPNGLTTTYSYRDPNAARTLSAYKGIGDFVKAFAASNPDLTGFIIGTVADTSPLMSAKAKGSLSDKRWFRGVTTEERRAFLEDIINSTPETLASLADTIQSTLDSGSVCVIAARNKLDECGEFDIIEAV